MYFGGNISLRFCNEKGSTFSLARVRSLCVSYGASVGPRPQVWDCKFGNSPHCIHRAKRFPKGCVCRGVQAFRKQEREAGRGSRACHEVMFGNKIIVELCLPKPFATDNLGPQSAHKPRHTPCLSLASEVGIRELASEPYHTLTTWHPRHPSLASELYHTLTTWHPRHPSLASEPYQMNVLIIPTTADGGAPPGAAAEEGRLGRSFWGQGWSPGCWWCFSRSDD